MGEKCLITIPDLCTGCNRCVYVCSALKEGQFSPSKARLHINNFSLNGYSVPSVCFQCPIPDCLEACPEKAITKDEQTGIVHVDENSCTGCGKCVTACPYGMIDLNYDQVATKCDLCGGDPSCVKECQFGALLFQEPDRDLKKARNFQRRQRFEGPVAEFKRHQLGENMMAQARE
ncbi:MAG: 4Fe-4S dicluster domain-containing protein [Desulfobacterales bacterium]|nr:4Fe-4S dicluster domain-containing protein [Desulfobacterales bacterium]